MKRIAIDATVLDRKMTGTGRFLFNLLNQLPFQDKENKYYLYSTTQLSVDRNFYAQVIVPVGFLPKKLFSVLWLQLIQSFYLRRHKIDIVLSPNIIGPSFAPKHTKIVTVIHDVIPMIYPEYYSYLYKLYLSIFMPPSIKKSSKLITVSESSKTDISRLCSVDPEKIEVVYNTATKNTSSDNIESGNSKASLIASRLPEKYLLYVGVIEKRKNIQGILRVLDILIEEGSQLKLVLVGRPGYGFDEIRPEIDKRLANAIYLEFIEEAELNQVYEHAFAFIFPSFYEGFGIPPLEAMGKKIPVIASNQSSLPEVVGKGGVLRSADDYVGFANEILKMERQPDYYMELRQQAHLQSLKFDIAKETSKLVQILEDTYFDD